MKRRRNNGQRRPWTGLVAVLLVGCALRPSEDSLPPLPADWAARRALLQQHGDFALQGRVAVVAGEQGFSAALRWSQRGAQTRLRLDGPLGLGALAIDADERGLRITNARGERLDGEAARAELERQLGFALPLESLRYWVRGLPAPFAPAEEVLEAQQPRLAQLQQQGWLVEYSEYQSAPAEHRPRRLVATNEVARVRLLIESWTR